MLHVYIYITCPILENTIQKILDEITYLAKRIEMGSPSPSSRSGRNSSWLREISLLRIPKARDSSLKHSFLINFTRKNLTHFPIKFLIRPRGSIPRPNQGTLQNLSCLRTSFQFSSDRQWAHGMRQKHGMSQ